jgi:CheY-like chemotaxis protein
MRRDPSISSQQRQYLDTINRSGEHLLALINDVLEMSKIEAGSQTLNVSTFDVHGLLEDLESMFRERAKERHLDIEVDISANVPRGIVSDQSKLRQILINLVGNALKFAQRGKVGLRVWAENGTDDEVALCIEVTDTGPGIAPEELPRLFQRFEQMDAGRSAGAGTGLGLVISREFARLMGGDITCTSELGKGSVFVARIPFRPGEIQMGESAMSAGEILHLKEGSTPPKILVADDIEENRGLLRYILEGAGFVVEEATNGEEAVATATQWHPDLILMDARMPEMDGHEAIRRIRADARLQQIKIITLTAGAFEENRQEAEKAGSDDFLSKPYREKELLVKIRDLLGVEYVTSSSHPPDPEEEKARFGERLPEPDMAVLPEALVDQLRVATTNADFDDLLALIAEAGTYDDRLAAFLRERAEKFDYENLLVLFTYRRRD